MNHLPPGALLRLHQIIGRRAITAEEAAHNKAANKRGRRERPAVIGLLNIPATTFYERVREGRYPKPIKHGRASLWKAEDVLALMDEIVRTGESK